MFYIINTIILFYILLPSLRFIVLTMSNIHIYYQNVRGLRSKTNEIAIEILNNNYDIICLTETFLNSSVESSEIFDNRYEVHRRDRESSASKTLEGGGTLIATSKRFVVHRLHSLETGAEDLWVNIKINKYTSFNLCTVYLPPRISSNTFNDFLTSCQKICLESNSGTQNIILGDFNAPSIVWAPDKIHTDTFSATNFSGNYSEMLLDQIALCNLAQFNGICNVNGRILDLILSDKSTLTVSLSEPLSKIDPHHPPLLIRAFVHDNNFLEINEDGMTRFNFYKADFSSCNESLASIDWISTLNKFDCNSSVTVLYDILSSVIRLNVPEKIKKNARYPIWFSRSLINCMKEKEKFHQKFKKYGNPRDYESFSILRKRSKKMLRTCRNFYISNIELNISNNVRNFWAYVKSKKDFNSLPKVMQHDNQTAERGEDICELLSAYFCSVFDPVNTNSASAPTVNAIPQSTYTVPMLRVSLDKLKEKFKELDISKGAGPDMIPPIFVRNCADELALPLFIIFNKSLQEGIFPDKWKTAHVVPIHKSGDSTNVRNYRPISILCTFSKVFESLMRDHLYLYTKLTLSDTQHGFMHNRSIISNLLEYTDYLCMSLDKRIQVDTVYTDFSKAFDKVNHAILLEKLGSFGIHGNLLRWLSSYISNRTQLVNVNGFKSAPAAVTSGVPQGSNLGPLLFLYYINDLCNELKCPHLFYADDLKIFHRISCSSDSDKIQNDLNTLNRWCTRNAMRLNIDKCHVITFTRNKSILCNNYYISDAPLSRVNHIRDLGIVFDGRYVFQIHFNEMIKKANKMLGFICRIMQPFRNPKPMLLVYNSVVRSILEFGTVIWNPLYKVHGDRIEKIQRKFTRMLSYKCGLRNTLNSYEDRLSHFEMLSLKERRTSADISCLYKLLHNKLDSPTSLANIPIRVPQRHSRNHNTFANLLHANNVSYNKPISRMCRAFDMNCYSNDIFNDTLANIKKSIHSKT